MQIPPIAIQIELEQLTSVVIHAKSFISEFMSKFCIKIFNLYEFQDQISKNWKQTIWTLNEMYGFYLIHAFNQFLSRNSHEKFIPLNDTLIYLTLI